MEMVKTINFARIPYRVLMIYVLILHFWDMHRGDSLVNSFLNSNVFIAI